MSSYQIDRQKWQSLTVFEQMGNIGSEIGRAMSAHKNGDSDKFLAAFSRALDLFDATAEAWAARRDSGRVREILRAREQFAKILSTGDDDPKLEAYFTRFAVAARLRQFS